MKHRLISFTLYNFNEKFDFQPPCASYLFETISQSYDMLTMLHNTYNKTLFFFINISLIHICILEKIICLHRRINFFLFKQFYHSRLIVCIITQLSDRQNLGVCSCYYTQGPVNFILIFVIFILFLRITFIFVEKNFMQ